MQFKTKMWKRSQNSFGTTIPHIVLLNVDVEKENEVVWEFDQKSNKWMVSIEKEKGKKNEKG